MIMKLQLFFLVALLCFSVASSTPVDSKKVEIMDLSLDGLQGLMNSAPADCEEGYLKNSNEYLSPIVPLSEKFRKIRIRLVRLVARLKSFVSITGFDAMRFEAQMNKISKILARLSLRIEQVPYPSEIHDRLVYANQIFQKMSQALNVLKAFDSQDTASHLVKCVIQLELMLISLHDFYGYPDPHYQDYPDLVNHLTHVLYSWAAIFKQLKSVPKQLNLLFYTHFSRADDTLGNLAKYILT